jgi:hypothetical protein
MSREVRANEIPIQLAIEPRRCRLRDDARSPSAIPMTSSEMASAAKPMTIPGASSP